MDEHTHDDRRALEQRVRDLERVCGEAYQLAGAIGAPERVLDVLAAAAGGKPIPQESFLPIAADDCDEIRALHERLDEVRRLVAR